jgi:signal transduction histidine kinase
MNMMLDRLELSDFAQRSVVSDASHELRSPLATLITAAELATTAARRRGRHHCRLTLHAEEATAVLWVDDDGAVIPPADRERIFERFVRLDDSRSRDEGGSGLGLLIARTTVESHGGQLVVAEAPDGRCRFLASAVDPDGRPGEQAATKREREQPRCPPELIGDNHGDGLRARSVR